MLGGATTWVGVFPSEIATPAQQGAHVPHFNSTFEWCPSAIDVALPSIEEGADPDSDPTVLSIKC